MNITKVNSFLRKSLFMKKTNQNSSRKFYKKKRFIVPMILIVGLIIFRIFLPTIVKNYVNKVLADIPSYYGQVEDIDIALIRGAYVIKGLYLNKVNAKTQVPFLTFPKTDISVEWRALFSGKIVSEIYMTNPEIIYVQEDMAGTVSDSTTTEADWTKALTDIVPLDINHFEITNGKLAFVSTDAEPTIDLQIYDLNLVADNLRNVKAKERTLPSSIFAEGNSIGSGKLSMKGNVNIIKEIPDMDIALSLENIDVTALNDFSNHYAKVDFEKGNLGLFTEIAIADGYLKGYVKTLLEDSKFIGKEDNFGEKLWEGFVGFFRFILKNQKTDTIAVKAPLEGDLSKVGTEIWSTIGSIFSNAFINAFKDGVDGEVEYEDAFVEGNEEDDLKWWQLRKKRQQKKEKENEEN